MRELSIETGMDVVIIRPVLVYGPGVMANFWSMMHWLDKVIPLPFGVIKNTRSFVALENLLDLIFTYIGHPAAANQTFLVSDGEDISTTQLLRKTAFTLGRKAFSNRFCRSLHLDIDETRSLLGWSPLVSADEALKITVQYFQYRKKL